MSSLWVSRLESCHIGSLLFYWPFLFFFYWLPDEQTGQSLRAPWDANDLATKNWHCSSLPSSTMLFAILWVSLKYTPHTLPAPSHESHQPALARVPIERSSAQCIMGRGSLQSVLPLLLASPFFHLLIRAQPLQAPHLGQFQCLAAPF